jgi:hypothetical protein
MRGNFFAELKRSNVYKAHQCQKGSDPAVQPMRNQLSFASSVRGGNERLRMLLI